jgi:hypothetical protein
MAPVHDLVDRLGVQAFGQGGESRHIGEQHGDLLPLALEGASRREDLLREVSGRVGLRRRSPRRRRIRRRQTSPAASAELVARLVLEAARRARGAQGLAAPRAEAPAFSVVGLATRATHWRPVDSTPVRGVSGRRGTDCPPKRGGAAGAVSWARARRGRDACRCCLRGGRRSARAGPGPDRRGCLPGSAWPGGRLRVIAIVQDRPSCGPSSPVSAARSPLRRRAPPHPPRRDRVESPLGGPSRVPRAGPTTAPLRPSLDRKPAPAQDGSASASDREADPRRWVRGLRRDRRPRCSAASHGSLTAG